MKKNTFFVTGLLFVLMALALAGCKTEDTGIDLPTTGGRLTITGLESYENKFAYAYGFLHDEENNKLECLTIKDNGIGGYYGETVEIKNGKAEIPVFKWKQPEGGASGYSGNDQVDFMSLSIYEQNVAIFGAGFNEAQPVATFTGTVTFVNGVGTWDSP